MTKLGKKKEKNRENNNENYKRKTYRNNKGRISKNS